MTVSTTTNVVTYVGTGSTDTYPYPFRIFDQSDLAVSTIDSDGVETALVLTTNYTVDGVLSYTGGNVTLVAGNLATGTTLRIARLPGQVQDTSLQSQGAYDAKIVENALDLLTMDVQALQTQIDDLQDTPPEVTWRDGQNLLMNGDGRVGQRGTYSGAVSTTRGYGVCDRWKGCVVGTAVAGTLTQATGLTYGLTGYGIKWSAMTLTGAAEAAFFQSIEAKDCGIVIGGYIGGSVLVYQDSGSDASVTVYVAYASAVDNFTSVVAFGLTVTTTVPSGTPTRITLPATLAPAGATNGLQFIVDCVFAGAITNKNLIITDAILHPGATAIDYTPEPMAVVFEKCQRYYWKSYPIATAPGAGGANQNGAFRTVALDASALYNPQVRFPTRMRIAPTVTVYSSNGGASGKVYDITASADKAAGAGLIGDTGCQVAGTASLSAADVVEFHATATADF